MQNKDEKVLNLNTLETNIDIIDIVDGLENSYGGIDEIICQQLDENNQVAAVKRFSDVIQFEQGFTPTDFQMSTNVLIKAPLVEKEFLIDKASKNLYIRSKRMDANSKSIIHYYIVDDETLVRREADTENFYRFDKETNEWVQVPSMIGLMNDGTFNFKEITEDDIKAFTAPKTI